LTGLEKNNKIEGSGNWKIYKSETRIEPYVGLHESFRIGTPILFAPSNLDPSLVNEILIALNENITESRNLLAFLTSGTTGAPKIVVHDKNTLASSARKIVLRYPSISGLKFHNLFPGTYMAGILNNGVLPLMLGSQIFLDEVYNFKSPLQLGAVSRDHQTEFAWVSPAMIASICAVSEKEKARRPSWKFALSATGPLGAQQFEEFNDLGITLRNTYGSTELLFISAQKLESNKLSCGTALENVSMQLLSLNDELNSGSYRILVSTDTNPISEMVWDFESKFYAPILISPKLRDTNDVGHISNAELHLVARSDDLVVLGGINFSLGELESYARQFRGVLEACAYAPYGGTFADLVLCYETSDNQPIDSKEFRKFISAKFGEGQSPRKLINMDLPRTHHGKVSRAKVVESFKK